MRARVYRSIAPPPIDILFPQRRAFSPLLIGRQSNGLATLRCFVSPVYASYGGSQSRPDRGLSPSSPDGVIRSFFIRSFFIRSFFIRSFFIRLKSKRARARRISLTAVTARLTKSPRRSSPRVRGNGGKEKPPDGTYGIWGGARPADRSGTVRVSEAPLSLTCPASRVQLPSGSALHNTRDPRFWPPWFLHHYITL